MSELCAQCNEPKNAGQHFQQNAIDGGQFHEFKPSGLYLDTVCKGSMALGSGCGQCRRCREEIKRIGFTPVRGSGAVVHFVAYKTGNFALQQISKMRLRPDVYAPVLFETAAGYGMPMLRPLQTPYQVRKALELLKTLWLQPMPYLREWQLIAAQRRAYYNYVRNLPADGLLMTKLDAVWAQARAQTHAIYSNHVHGDATLENCMWSDAEHRPYWIDPCVRRDPCCAPLEAEVDMGKLLQSYFGYEQGISNLNMEVRAELARFLFDEMCVANALLTRFYFVSHLVRMWRHQPAKREWIMAQVRSNLAWT